MLMRLIEVEGVLSSVRLDIRIRAIATLNTLIQKCDMSDYASRILHPLCQALMVCYAEPPFTSAMLGGVALTSSSNGARRGNGGAGEQTVELNSRHLFCALMEF
ncbi:hypothetical protein BASA81_015436 [Batrachochytrium salamandrivorans]|nr:hypothetical protein BASA81_015436 [Batrachochytrium salamandrivorans]